MNELAFVTVCALAGGKLMPLLALLCFVVFVLIIDWLKELVFSVRKCALVVELTIASIYKVLAELCLVIDPEILNISEHLSL